MMPGVSWDHGPTDPQGFQAWSRHGARLHRQWREQPNITGPLWFGRSGRPELVAMPTGQWAAVWAAATAAVDADRVAECRARLTLDDSVRELAAAEVARALGATHHHWAGHLRVITAAVADLTQAGRDGSGDALVDHLAGRKQRRLAVTEELERSLYWDGTRAWLSYWRDEDLALLQPAPQWLGLSIAPGPSA